MLVFHNFHFAKNSKTSQRAAASLWLTAHVPAAGSTRQPRRHEDAQCQPKPELGFCHQTSAGLPWGSPAPHDTLHQHGPIIPSFSHQLQGYTLGWTFSGVISGSCVRERGGDGGGRVLGTSAGRFPISRSPGPARGGCRTAGITSQTPPAHSSLCCPIFHHPPQRNVYFPFKSSPRII